MSTLTPERSPKPITVLLVDDDIGFAQIVQQQLKQFQGREFKLIWKENVEDALVEVQTNSAIDLIITDFVLPGGRSCSRATRP